MGMHNIRLDTAYLQHLRVSHHAAAGVVARDVKVALVKLTEATPVHGGVVTPIHPRDVEALRTVQHKPAQTQNTNASNRESEHSDQKTSRHSATLKSQYTR